MPGGCLRGAQGGRVRLHSHPQDPCPKLRNWVGGAGHGPGRTVRVGPGLSAFPPATPELVPGSVWRSPCNKPLHCQAPKTPSPVCLPACLPATELPECPQLSLLLICPWVFLPAGSGRQESIPQVVAGVIPQTPDRQRNSHPGSTGLLY